MRHLFIVIILFFFSSVTWQCRQAPKTKPSISDQRALKKGEKILEIDYDLGGGYPGGSTTLRITPDSSVYFYDWYVNGTWKLTMRTPKEKWNELTANLNLAEFDKTPNSPAQREKDGIDIRLYIKTSVRTHRLIIDLDNAEKYTVAGNLLKTVAYQVDKMGKHAILVKAGHGPVNNPISIKLHSDH